MYFSQFTYYQNVQLQSHEIVHVWTQRARIPMCLALNLVTYNLASVHLNEASYV